MNKAIPSEHIPSLAFPGPTTLSEGVELSFEAVQAAGYPKWVIVTFLDVEVASAMVRESDLPQNGAPLEAIGLGIGTTHDGLRLILAQTWDPSTKMSKVVRIPVSSIQKMVLLNPSS